MPFPRFTAYLDLRSTAPIHVQLHGGGQPADWKLASPNNKPFKVEKVGPFEFLYESSISDEQAGKLVAWMSAEGHITGERGLMVVRKNGNAVAVYIPADGIDLDAKVEDAAREMARRISAEVLGGEPVEVHLADRRMKLLKVVADR